MHALRKMTGCLDYRLAFRVRNTVANDRNSIKLREEVGCLELQYEMEIPMSLRKIIEK